MDLNSFNRKNIWFFVFFSVSKNTEPLINQTQLKPKKLVVFEILYLSKRSLSITPIKLEGNCLKGLTSWEFFTSVSNLTKIVNILKTVTLKTKMSAKATMLYPT